MVGNATISKSATNSAPMPVSKAALNAQILLTDVVPCIGMLSDIAPGMSVDERSESVDVTVDIGIGIDMSIAMSV
ncbi:hypothetical protein WM40_10315 [Robbsia andropogonis]|uniref:Uncharacterized protein n=1 Tax=Robbsia andropogonis TaxID=28092 RepID=A0A0F5K0T4_9BURK|nr:hypothetical protein WM40_10315 [Robbsia andropogonis]